jgi:DNA-binding NarL/FixJ family response regulator
MNSRVEPVRLLEQLRVLLVGNNPIELSSMLTNISSLHGQTVRTETAFDARSILDRLLRFKPSIILIDDNIGLHEMQHTVHALAHHRNAKNVPITILKNSNYQETSSSLSILDYLLKRSLTPESLNNALHNSIKMRRAQVFLSNAYKKRKRLLSSFLKSQ